MKVSRAGYAGFCFGVNNAVKTALESLEKYRDVPIFTLGELIHNDFVVESLKKKGIGVIHDTEEIDDGVVIIRSHGVTKSVIQSLHARGIETIDATCPYVKSIQNKVEIYHEKGYTIVIVGDKTHPEVIGVNGWCENEAVVLYSVEEAKAFQTDRKVCVVAQTTIIKDLFDDICSIIQTKYPDTVIFNTICSATAQRQRAASELAESSDAMIVIGGKKSSNTKKLVEICKDKCSRVWHIQTAADLDKTQFRDCETIGVTAGASTPEEIILEVLTLMDNANENFEQLLDDVKTIRKGDIVTGEVISVNDSEVFVNIGYKSDGVIKKNDFVMDLYTDLPSSVAVGDKVDAMVIEMNDGTGNVALSKIKVDEIAAFDEAEKKFESKETVQGKITKIVKGGVIVDLGFAKGYMPASQYALRYTEDLNALLGKEVEGRIIDCDKTKNKIIISRRVILQEQRDAKREENARIRQEAFDALEVGQVVSGPVKNIAAFGIFIELNGIDGFVHISDLSWGRVQNAEKFCKVGDVLEAKVIELDAEKMRVKLSIKAMTVEPWQAFIDQYKEGDVVNVTIKKIVTFGAFAEILPGVEGLIHISNLAHRKVAKVEDVVKVDQQLDVKIITIDRDNRKIGLSLKEMIAAPKKTIEKEKLIYSEDSSNTLEDAFKKYLNK